jgi:hypothetical protein
MISTRPLDSALRNLRCRNGRLFRRAKSHCGLPFPLPRVKITARWSRRSGRFPGPVRGLPGGGVAEIVTVKERIEEAADGIDEDAEVLW